jgi:putative type I restriction-modification system specificity protein
MNNAKNTTLLPYLERLLEGEEVEWKTLGEVAEFKRGQTITQKTAQAGVYPVISGGQQPAYYIDQYNRTGQTITVAGSGAYAGFIMFWNEPIFVSDAFSIKANEEVLLPRYVFHFLLNKQSSIFNLKKGVGVPHVYAKDLAVFSIPIPPLRVQARIVEILDKFTQLEKELAAELEARKKQYAYYRDQLLNFSQYPPLNVNIEWRTLGEVCENICSGGTPSTKKEQYYQGTIPWLRTQDIDWREVYDTEIKITEEAIANSSAKLIPTNCVIVAMYGATAAKACINKIPLTTNQACCNLQVDEKVAHYKYVYYWITNEYERLKAQGEGCQGNLNAKKIKSYKIPIPPLSEQHCIVDILDRFDTLINSISEGLPKEIALRRKQYEYYRDALLNFPRAEVTA